MSDGERESNRLSTEPQSGRVPWSHASRSRSVPRFPGRRAEKHDGGRTQRGRELTARRSGASPVRFAGSVGVEVSRAGEANDQLAEASLLENRRGCQEVELQRRGRRTVDEAMDDP